MKANPNCKVETGWTLPLIQLLPSQFAEIEEAAEEPAPKLVIVYDVEDQQAADGLLDKLKTKGILSSPRSSRRANLCVRIANSGRMEKAVLGYEGRYSLHRISSASGGKPKILPNEISAKEVAQLLRMPAPK